MYIIFSKALNKLQNITGCIFHSLQSTLRTPLLRILTEHSFMSFKNLSYALTKHNIAAPVIMNNVTQSFHQL